MTDDPISERDGMTLAEMQWRDEHDRVTPPVLRAMRELVPCPCGNKVAPIPTDREMEVLAIYVETCSYKETAARLHIGISAAKSSMFRMLKRTGCVGVAQAAYRLGRGDWTREARV